MNSVQNPAYQAGMDARFAVAARHSRMVRVLRIAVPAAVILAMAAIVAVSIFNPFRLLLPKLPLDMGNLVVSGTRITMESPHLSGYSTDQRPYELWAKTATQDLTDPDHVELNTLRAKVLMEDRTTVTMEARHGIFDSKQQLLDLHKDIFLQSSTGYEARLSQAFVDIAKGSVTSEERVDVKLLNGTLAADRLQDHRGRRSRAIRGQRDDEFGHGAPDSARRTRRPPTHPPCPDPASVQDAVHLRQARQPEMIFRMMFSSRRNLTRRNGKLRRRWSRLHLRADRSGRSQRAKRGAGRAQRHAGVFAKSRPADPDRSRFARDARQEKGSDLCRQCEGGAGRHHHDVQEPRGVLRCGLRRRGAAGAPAKSAKSAPLQAATPGPGGSSSIRRLEAKGNVVVTQKDQVVTGETAVFDTKANLITMLGGVVLTQCKNVLRGDRLLVDMTTGVSRVESDSGRVQGLFISVRARAGPAVPGTPPSAAPPGSVRRK